jgi:hypothetical protein
MLANVFSNTTPRVEEAEGVPLLGLALSLCLMAAIAALAFVACGTLIHSPPAWRPTGYFNRMASWIRTRPAGIR